MDKNSNKEMRRKKKLLRTLSRVVGCHVINEKNGIQQQQKRKQENERILRGL